MKTAPPITRYVFEGTPEGLRAFGVEGAVKYFLPNTAVTVCRANSPEGSQFLREGNAAILRWDQEKRKLEIDVEQSAGLSG